MSVEDEDPTQSPDGSSRRGLVRRLLDGLRGSSAGSSSDIPGRLGRYRIVDRLGQGGMGTVFAAEDESLGRRVAVKIITEPDESTRRRFRREARAAAGVNHPNVCQVYEIGEDRGQLFLAMELLTGEALSSRLARGPMEPVEVISLGRGVLAALTALHETGIIHRDLKPSNVFLTPHGVKLLDFGLARPVPKELTRSIEQGTELTQPGLVIGTPRYMAPEQVLGRDVDARTDLFATATILYEAVTGRPAFLGETVVEVLSATLHDQPPPLTGDATLEALDRVLRHGLAKQPADRPATAAEMAAEIEEIAEIAGTPSSSGARPLAVRASRPSIAVLPFTNMSPDKDQDYFCEGMAEDVLNALTKVDGLRVVARASSFRFAGKSHDVAHIGKALEVDHILEGSVRTAGDRLRVTAQLIRVDDSSHVWSQRYDRQKEDVFAIQDEISEHLVDALRVRLVGEGRAEPVRRHTDDVEAYHLFLKGQHNWYRRESDSLQKAAAFFEEAARKDPAYALAHVGLANAYSSLGYYGMEPVAALEKARAAVERALALDDRLAEAHSARGLMQMWLLWDWEGAEQSFKASIERSPEHVLGRCWYSFLLGSTDRQTESLRMAESALALDPLSPYVITCLGLSHFNQGENERAIEVVRGALDMEPGFLYTHWVLGGACARSGRHEEALSVLEKAVALSGRAPYYLGWLVYAYGAAGRHEEGLAIVEELKERAGREYVAPTFLAWAFTGLGEREEALTWIEKAYETQSPPLAMHHATLLGDLRSEERFREIRRRMKLDP
jgi:serine/threonine protein kinase/tetratricopeptide (TPR) repeat protein